jgi:4-coumarate--CoA ligase
MWGGLRAGMFIFVLGNLVGKYLRLLTLRMVGGRVNGASPAYNTEEMTHALKTAQSRFLITLPSSLEVALAAAKNAGIPQKHIFLLEGSVDGFVSIQELMKRGERYQIVPPWRIPKGKDNRQICGYLNFSSGTTGLPKVRQRGRSVVPEVMLTEGSRLLCSRTTTSSLNVISSGNCKPLVLTGYLPSCLCSIVSFEQHTEDCEVERLTMMTVTGLVRFCTYPIFMNGDSVMLPAFTMPTMLQAIVDFQIKELILVPPIIIRLVRDKIVDNYDLRHVERWSSGSAPISPEIIALLRKKFPWTGFRQGYGATESTACISCHPPTHYDYKYATTGGMLVANTIAKVLDLTTGKELGAGETGEICARGPQIAMAYLDNPAASAETFDKYGFFHTGDVGHIDAEGLFHIEDRIKEMIKVKGLQVPPAELEDLLLGHPEVEDCAVLGIQDEYSGEKPKAYIVLKAGVPESNEVGKRLLQFVKERKVRYKWVKEIEFTDAVPKSPTGKLLRRILKVKDKEGKDRGFVVRDETERPRL